MKVQLIALALLTLSVSCTGKIDGEIPEGGLVVDIKPTPTNPTTPTTPTVPTEPTTPTNPTTPTEPTVPTTPSIPAPANNPFTAGDVDSEVLGNANAGANLLGSETPSVVAVDPVKPVEMPSRVEVTDATIVETQLCTGRGEPGLTFSSRIDFYSDNSRVYAFSLWNREAVIESFVTMERPGATNSLRPRPTTVGSPISSKVQHGFTQGYREFLGYAEGASIYQQLFVSDDRGGLELRVGQIGDETKPEFFGLDAARCVKL